MEERKRQKQVARLSQEDTKGSSPPKAPHHCDLSMSIPEIIKLT